MKRAWTIDFGNYHAHCDVIEERKGEIEAVVQENGVEIHRTRIGAASVGSAVPYAIGVIGEQFKGRIYAATDAELTRAKEDVE